MDEVWFGVIRGVLWVLDEGHLEILILPEYEISLLV
jgi:hypothetical protein